MNDSSDDPPREVPALGRDDRGRWERGTPSPNPKGRPPKPKTSNLLASIDPATAAFLEFDRRDTGLFDRDGNPVTNGETIFLSLQKLAMHDPRAAEIYLRRRDAAEAEERRVRLEAGAAAALHVEQYMKAFMDAERQGRPAPNVLPDPRDIIFDGAGDFRIVGPITHEQREALQGIIETRDFALKLIDDLETMDHLTEAQKRDIWKHCRRRIYSLNRVIPPRLKKSVPPFPSA